MVHPDEGTIHAWLDGALAPDESLQIEAHISSCERCQAAVAEARGFVAASTRILSALDDVPAEVIPTRSATTVIDIRHAAAARRTSRLRQLSAIAATLLFFVSGGVYMLQSGDNVSVANDSVALGERIAETAARDQSINDSTRVPGAADAATVASVSAPAPAQSAPSTDSRANVGSSRQLPPTRQGSGAVTGQAKQDVAATVAAAPPTVPVPPPTTAEAARGASTSPARDVAPPAAGNAAGAAAQKAVASADSVMKRDTSTALRTNQVRERTVAAAPPVAVPLPSPAITGCYTIASLADLSVADSRRDESAIVSSLPSRIRLTDSVIGEMRGSQRYLARSVTASGTSVRRFAWSQSASGAVMIYVGDSVRAPGITATMDSTGGGGIAAARLRKVGCP
jgi:hypothetical protein